jgi:anthranilate synthase component 1
MVLQLDRAGFEAMARDHSLVPVWRYVLADLQTPVGAFMRLDPRPNGFLLESVEGGERWARYSFLGGDAFGVVKSIDGRIVVDGDVPIGPDAGETPLRYVRRLLDSFDVPPMSGLPPLHGGAVGFIGYDCVRELERLPDAPPDDLGLPDLALLLTRTFVVFDHLSQKLAIFCNVPVGEASSLNAAYDDAVERIDDIVHRLSAPLDTSSLSTDFEALSWSVKTTVRDEEYAAWVEEAKEHIFAGDIFQVVPSRRFESELVGSGFDVYRALRTMNPSPYMYYLRFAGDDNHPEFEIAGSSPEPLVRVSDRKIVTRPIAGTRRRGVDEEEDQRIAEELLADEKERAEHVMLVDLARNDVGRVSEYGSVTVDELMIIERYSHVMHIVSNVTGVLREGLSAFDALTACFPAGTVSGAPKVRAMEIIDSLEKTRRGPYAGVVGYFDFSGNLDTCITIRTVVATGGRAYVQAGAGVVADSEPVSEANETNNKAEVLLEAVAAAARFAQSS